MTITVYGIKNCDSVKKARKWLDTNGHEHAFVDFRADPQPPEKVAAWVSELGAKALKNTSGGSYRALPPEKKQWDDQRWAAQMAADPMLIKRPVIEREGVAVHVGSRDLDRLA
jgi:arsenate reductase (glutaredoxin)